MSYSLVAISSFCQTGSGTTPSRKESDFYGGEIPWIKSGELRESEILGSEEFVTEKALRTTSLKKIPAGSILVAMYGATVGRVGILGIDATTNQAVCHIIPDKRKADTRYMFHALQHKAAELVSRGVGGAQPNISQGVIKETKIPLPPVAEQKHIAAILDQADSLRRLRQRAIDRLNTLGQAIFYEMFGDPVANSMGWNDQKTLGEVAEIVSGITKGRKLNGNATRPIPYLAVVNVQDKELRLADVKVIEATEEEINRYRLKNDDLLLTEGGDPDKLGRGTLWHDEISECIHQNHIFRVRLHGDEIAPVFLNWLIGSARGKNYFLRSAKQTTGIASINMTQLRGFPLLLPPSDIQKEFSRRLLVLDAQKSVYRSAYDTVSSLFSSLQHRAFRGEL